MTDDRLPTLITAARMSAELIRDGIGDSRRLATGIVSSVDALCLLIDVRPVERASPEATARALRGLADRLDPREGK